MAAYHFHGKAADIPLAITELIFSPRGYAGFDYYILQEGDLLIGYFSDKGQREMHDYAVENLFDATKRGKVLEGIKAYDEKLTRFAPSPISSEMFQNIKGLMREFGEQYFIMEQPWLLALEEVIMNACEREGLRHDEILVHPEKAKNFSEQERELLDTLIELGHIKLSVHTHSEPVMHAFYEIYHHISEVEKISLKHAESFTTAEIEEYLKSGTLPKDNLELRSKGVVFIPGGKDNPPRMGTHEEYRKWKDILEPPFVGEIKGAVACRGKVQGRVTVHLGWINITEIPPGNILVTGMTNPQMVPYIKHASAIVTDEGGLACHAAIISREMKIPCIVGTKVATRVLKDGDLVEVDADNGVVRIIEKT